MTSEHSFVVLFFRLINEGILIGVLLYLFRRHVLGSLYQQRAAERLALNQLHEDNAKTTYLYESLLEEIRQQQVFAEQIQKNIVRWREWEQHQRDGFDQEREQLEKKLTQKADIQSQYLVRVHARDSILPEALRTVTHTLSEQYEGIRGDQYLAHTVRLLEKKI